MLCLEAAVSARSPRRLGRGGWRAICLGEGVSSANLLSLCRHPATVSITSVSQKAQSAAVLLFSSILLMCSIFLYAKCVEAINTLTCRRCAAREVCPFWTAFPLPCQPCQMDLGEGPDPLRWPKSRLCHRCGRLSPSHPPTTHPGSLENSPCHRREPSPCSLVPSPASEHSFQDGFAKCVPWSARHVAGWCRQNPGTSRFWLREWTHEGRAGLVSIQGWGSVSVPQAWPLSFYSD